MRNPARPRAFLVTVEEANIADVRALTTDNDASHPPLEKNLGEVVEQNQGSTGLVNLAGAQES